MKPLAWSEVRRAAPSIVALGNFDGVHLGHRKILDQLVSESAKSGLTPVVITFEPHPRYYFKPWEKPSLLSTPKEKLDLLRQWPVEVIPLTFGKSLAELEPEEFIQDFLKERLLGRRFLLGGNHRFGRRARGDAKLLQAMAPGADAVLVSEPLRMDGEIVSSSAIRTLLEASRLTGANRMLGRSFSYSGPVVRGDGRGHALGFPTANIGLDFPFKAVAAHGVYAGEAWLDGNRHPAVANIGTTPTFGENRLKVEVHLLDFESDIYGRELEFRLQAFLRPEKKFDSVDALREQIAGDISLARETR